MPLLDVSDILLDPDFADVLIVTRSVQTFTNGYASNSSKSWQISGVVTMVGGQELIREPSGERNKQTIRVATKARLTDGRIKSDGITMDTADILTWNGNQYTVVQVDDYSRYGEGFVQAVAELIPITG